MAADFGDYSLPPDCVTTSDADADLYSEPADSLNQPNSSRLPPSGSNQSALSSQHDTPILSTNNTKGLSFPFFCSAHFYFMYVWYCGLYLYYLFHLGLVNSGYKTGVFTWSGLV